MRLGDTTSGMQLLSRDATVTWVLVLWALVSIALLWHRDVAHVQGVHVMSF